MLSVSNCQSPSKPAPPPQGGAKANSCWLAAVSIVGIVFAGDLSLERFWQHFPALPVRIVFVAALIGSLLPKMFSKRGCVGKDTGVLIPTLSALAVYGYVLTNLVTSRWTERTDELAIKTEIILLSLALIFAACLKFGRSLIDQCAVICSIIGTIWAGGYFFNILTQGPSQQSIQFATAFTFYRIEVVSFFCALYLVNTEQKLLWLWRLFAFVCLTACLASSAKAAWVSGLIALCAVLFVRLVWFSGRDTLALCVVSIAAVAGAVLMTGSFFGARFEQSIAGGRFLIDKIGHQSVTSQSKLDRGVIIGFSAINGRYEPDWLEVSADLRDEIARYRERYALLPDFSFRTRMLSHAITKGFEEKWFGHGFSAYRLETTNYLTREPEVYRYPHNLAAEFFYSGGFVGVGVLVAAVLLAFGGVLKFGRYIETALPFLASALALLVGALFAGDFADLLLFWSSLIFAATVASASSHRSAKFES